MPTAYLLIAHGSRDPRLQIGMNRLAQLVRDRLAQPTFIASRQSLQPIYNCSLVNSRSGALAKEPLLVPPRRSSKLASREINCSSSIRQHALAPERLPALVGTAVLELGPSPLHQQICEFGRRVNAAGVERLRLIPLFLAKGRHVMEDIPAEVNQAQRLLENALELQLCPHMGSHPQMAALIAKKLAVASTPGKLLIAHGSRLPRGNQAIESLAKHLGMTAAYWSTPPDLETQAIHLMQQGCQEIGILPYFLFPGGITDAVIHLTEELAERFPRVKFRMLPPLGATAELAELVFNWREEPVVERLVG